MTDDSVTCFINPEGFFGPDSSRSAQIVVLRGAERGTSVELAGPVTTIGRRPDNNLVLNSASISKYHGRVRREGFSYFVEDLGSTNGIVVNSTRLSEAESRRLCHGDTLQLSEHILVFHNPEPLVDSKGNQ